MTLNTSLSLLADDVIRFRINNVVFDTIRAEVRYVDYHLALNSILVRTRNSTCGHLLENSYKELIKPHRRKINM